ncbi:MAG: cellulase family glycosylhydrolase [Bdellovibrio sp.]|nr:cellulase family glycosylhydrolase [Bdellovibrio sp.]
MILKQVTFAFFLFFAATVLMAESFVVRDGFIRDNEGRSVIFRGVNLSEYHKQAPYFDYHQLPDYQRVRSDWGMNSVRFLISWAAIEPARGVIDYVYLDELKRRMDWAHEAGLSVILDMHQDIYGVGFASGNGDGAPAWTCHERWYQIFRPIKPWFLNYLTLPVAHCLAGFWGRDETLRDHMILAWRVVAQKLAHHPAIVGFDPMNEPFWYNVFSFEKKKLEPFYDQIILAVRSESPEWLVFLEPASSRNFGFSTKLTPKRYENVVYSPHSYDIKAESGGAFKASHRKKLLRHAVILSQEAQKLGAALWIGEYGGQPANPGIFDYMDVQYEAIGAVGAGSMYWNYAKDEWYGMLHADGSEKTELMRALVRPYPERIAGTLHSYAFDHKKKEFRVRYIPDSAIQAPSILAIPPRIFPHGYQVNCHDCRFEKEAGRLLIWSQTGSVEEITLRGD